MSPGGFVKWILPPRNRLTLIGYVEETAECQSGWKKLSETFGKRSRGTTERSENLGSGKTNRGHARRLKAGSLLFSDNAVLRGGISCGAGAISTDRRHTVNLDS